MDEIRMYDEAEAAPRPARDAGDLEPYRQLVDLQRQVVELIQRREQLKRECELMQEQLAAEAALRNDKFVHRQARRVFRAGLQVFRAMERGVTIRRKGPRNPQLL